jgi:hypothetical protein
MKKEPDVYEIEVAAAQPTLHCVTAGAGDVECLTGGKANAERLIEESFRFLLERESNTSILRSFRQSINWSIAAAIFGPIPSTSNNSVGEAAKQARTVPKRSSNLLARSAPMPGKLCKMRSCRVFFRFALACRYGTYPGSRSRTNCAPI